MTTKLSDQFKANTFLFYALRYREALMPDAQIRATDMTTAFWAELEQHVKKEEFITVNINAKVRMGKSTAGILIAQRVHDMMEKAGQTKGTFGMRNIARDQLEYSRKMTDPLFSKTVILTDEINALEETGENATVEKAMLADFSNVQADRYVHRISCSPKGVTDPNADVFIEVVATDRTLKLTHCDLYYRMFHGGIETMQLLGHVNLHVGPLIKAWESHVKPIFYKKERTPLDEEIIQHWKNKDLYVDYYIRKREKIDMLSKHGVLRPRELQYARPMLKTLEALEYVATHGRLTKGQIRATLTGYFEEEGIPLSMFGQQLKTEEIAGILEMTHAQMKALKTIVKLRENEGNEEQITELQKLATSWGAMHENAISKLRRNAEMNTIYANTGT